MRIAKSKILVIAVISLGAMASGLMGRWLLRQGVKERILASGRFHQVAHKGEGTATIYQMLNGDRELHLSDFKTGEGPGLEVYLINAPDAFENETVERSESLSLGALRQHEGNHIYRLPGEADLRKCGAVTIWSTKYRVNFTTAPLRPPNP
jgi:hypothetical protein